MNLELHVGQVLRCTREHYGLSPVGVFAVNVGDLLLVVETTSFCQGRGVRLDDGVEISLLTLEELAFDDSGNFAGGWPPAYEALR